MDVLSRLVDDLNSRKEAELYTKNGTPDTRHKWHRMWSSEEFDARYLVELTYGHVLTAIERRATLSTVTKGMGASIMRKLKLKAKDGDNRFEKEDVEAVHIGWYMLKSYFELGILSYKGEKRKNKNGRYDKYYTYYLQVVDSDAMAEIASLIDTDSVDMFPTKQAPDHWVHQKFTHPTTGYNLIKHAHENAIKQVKTNDTSYLIDTLNKLGDTGWRINKFVFDVFKKSRYWDKTPFSFSKEVDREKIVSLMVEINAIETLAERNLDNAFYHLYNVDFRGRIYPNTAFLHEQSSDNAKGLLLLDKSVPLGDDGLYWLTVHTANMWGNDKVSLDERSDFVMNNWDTYMSYVADPKGNDSWMDADKPLCFLACCYELSLINKWVNVEKQRVEDFPSNLPVYIDGSNNGVQHLVAMSKDEEIAPLVNLVPRDVPGDVYMYIAEHTMSRIGELLLETEQKKVDAFSTFFKEFQRLLKEAREAPVKTERAKIAWAELKKFKNHNYDYFEDTMAVYWSQITDRKIWRKTLKRNVMTLAYGGTERGMGQQIIDDTRGLSEYHRDMSPTWGYKLGRLVHGICYDRLPGPAKMLYMFEALAKQENKKDLPITYTQIVTGFPFVHSYREPNTVRVKLFYGDEMLRINIQVWKAATLRKGKQETGASPNIVHSLDAVHLTMCVHDADYPVTVVHDSFGSHAGNMNHMFAHVREKFVELYDMDPLLHIMSQMDAQHLIPSKGNLDVSEVIKSNFAFA